MSGNIVKGIGGCYNTHKCSLRNLFVKKEVNMELLNYRHMSESEVASRHKKLVYIEATDCNGEILERSANIEELAKRLSEQTKTLYAPDAMALVVNYKRSVQFPLLQALDRALIEKEISQLKGIIHLSITKNHLIYIPNIGKEPLYCSEVMGHIPDRVYKSTAKEYGLKLGHMLKLGIRSLIVAPLFYDSLTEQDPIGVFMIGSNKDDAWIPLVDLPTLRQLADFAAIPLKQILDQ